MSMREFIDHWVGDREGSLLYLKDWHFVKVCPHSPVSCSLDFAQTITLAGSFGCCCSMFQ
uniref:Uncharacterized protein n=1 Tax=Arundo donax TaxID=35708 RepID=A0A0A9CF60_ARUDO